MFAALVNCRRIASVLFWGGHIYLSIFFFFFGQYSQRDAFTCRTLESRCNFRCNYFKMLIHKISCLFAILILIIIIYVKCVFIGIQQIMIDTSSTIWLLDVVCFLCFFLSSFDLEKLFLFVNVVNSAAKLRVWYWNETGTLFALYIFFFIAVWFRQMSSVEQCFFPSYFVYKFLHLILI